MIVTLINRERIRSLSLPQKISGRYWLTEDKKGKDEKIVSIEGVNGEWILKAGRKIAVYENGKSVKNLVLQPLSVYVLEKADRKKLIVFTEPVTDNRQLFTKYLVQGDSTLSIGRNPLNEIFYSNRAVSSSHAELRFRNNTWSIRDVGSANGTFVNGKKITTTVLNIGDSVYIMGLRIIVGKNFFAINNPDENVTVTDKVRKFISQPIEKSDEDEEYELPESESFYRSPRFKRDVETAEIRIDPPPDSPLRDEMPWPLVMGSSFAMGAMSFVTIGSALVTGNITSILMGAAMLIGTVLLPIITKKYEKKKKREKEAKRQERYTAYLNELVAQINGLSRYQESILHENYVSVAECESRILKVKTNLWERGYGQNDFLRVRLGTSDMTLDAKFEFSERRFSIEDDNLKDDMYSICEQEHLLHNVPITYSLYDDYVSGVVGDKKRVVEFAKGLIFQLASFYSYDEVKFIAIYDHDDEKEFEFIKWLPHVWSDDYKFRYIATDRSELKEIASNLEMVIDERSEMNDGDLDDASPYYIIFSLSKDLALRSEMLKKIFAQKKNLHISVVALYDEIKNLHKECSKVVELSNERGQLFDKNDISGKVVLFYPDAFLSSDPRNLSVVLSNIPIDISASSFKLPSMITFLQMYNVGKVEHLNALVRWKENDPTRSLEASVGIDTFGEIFKLDLHEKFHGPHGLVAGMTGSGKSEFIITYILSLALNYHPYEVAFILIDYKGGGMAKSFESLPHTAGIITNLDGAAIKRSLISIESELKRRQTIFSITSKRFNVSNIDIYKYQKLYREGAVSEPLQHLFIISDEFAELKTQQPEFMTQLVSAARIGRSLGVHLILATQKPSGVVDDQIWSNSKFRVCLKVQERADSMDMLKRPEAAELTETGRFYLQVGYNELFELGQSAWSGAPYVPSDKVHKEKDNSVVVVDKNGHPIKEVKPRNDLLLANDTIKQLDAITSYIRKIAEDEGIKIKPLWLEPIPAVILIDDIRKKYDTASEPYVLNPVIGEYDDPVHQNQCVLRLPISKEGNVVVYGVTGSGKTTFLNAMLYSLLNEHSAEEVNIFILDFASETLKAFEKAPHVGDVILSYEAEKIKNLFRMLYKEVNNRKKLFADYGGDYYSYLKMSGNKIPSFVVAINNYSAFIEAYEDMEEAVSFLTREGTKFGIYFVLTATSTSSVRFRMLQNFKQLFVLQLNDVSDYPTVVGKTNGLLPSNYKGRGLVRRDDLYEFQIASLIDDVPFEYIRVCCDVLNSNWFGERAQRIPVLPDVVNTGYLSGYIKGENDFNLPVGVETDSLNIYYYPFASSYINLIYSSGVEHRKFTADLCELISMNTRIKSTVFDFSKTVKSLGSVNAFHSTKQCEDEVARLFETVVERNNTYKTIEEEGGIHEPFEQLLVVINSFTEFKESLSDVGQEKLSLILEKGRKEYNVVIIIADNVNSIGSSSYEKWFKSQVSNGDAIWIGRGINDQYQLKIGNMNHSMSEDISSSFGFAVRNGKAKKLKVLRNGTEDDYE